jgi:non-ribosomal peptide synthetase component F
MDATTIGGLLEHRAAADEDLDDPVEALRTPGEPERRYDAARLLADAQKTGNFLRQLGVGPGRTIAIADRPTPESVLSLFGTALLGGSVRYVPLDGSDSEAPAEIDARVLIGPTDRLEGVPTTAATKRLGYGRAPGDPETAYFEREVWSENPTFPPSDVGEGAIAIEIEERNYTHREVIAAAERFVDERSLEPGTEIVVRAPLADVRAVVAGVLAPLASGGMIVFPDSETTGDLAVIAGDRGAPEPTTIDVADVPLESA